MGRPVRERNAQARPDAVDALHRRIDDIVSFQKKRGPWYRDPALIISASAFFISVMTTVVSWHRTYQQDVSALKTQLRAAIQQANNLAMQNMELYEKFKNDNSRLLNAASILNTQNVIVAKEAYSLAKALGNAASSLELASAAQALLASDESLLAEDLLNDAVTRAENSVSYAASLRSLSALQFQNGQRGEANASFNRALAVFDQFPKEANNQDYVNITQAYTYLFWSSTVKMADCGLAKETLTKVDQYLARLPPDLPQADVMRREAQRLNLDLSGC
jgi:hypothetical protein